MPQRIPLEAPDLMTPGEVAAALKVVPRTVTRYATYGQLTFDRTLGGHRRYHRASVEAFISNQPAGRAS